MKEIKEELEKSLKSLSYEEIADIYSLAVAKVAIKAAQELNRLKGNETDVIQTGKNSQVHAIVDEIMKEQIEFLDWLKKDHYDVYLECEREVKKKNPERTEIIFTMQCFIELLEMEEPDVFLEFDQLSNIFKYINFNLNYQLRLIINIVRTNVLLDKHPDAKSYVPDIPGLLEHKYKHISKEEVIELFRNGTLEEFLKDEEPENPKAQKELRKRFHSTKRDYTDRQHASHKLNAIFIKKANELTEEDYQTIVTNMNTIFCDHLAYRIIKFLKKNNSSDKNLYELLESKKNVVENTENKKTPTTTPVMEEKKKTKPQKKTESPKKQTNLNQTIREISKYFDLDTGDLKESLSLDQIIYVLSLMYSIDIEKDKEEVFLRRAMREYKQMHPYAILNQGYDKFKRLSNEDAEVKEHLDMIEYILSEVDIFICDNKKYKSTKELIEEEIKELIRITNGNYTYEVEEAKKLLNTNKE